MSSLELPEPIVRYEVLFLDFLEQLTGAIQWTVVVVSLYMSESPRVQHPDGHVTN